MCFFAISIIYRICIIQFVEGKYWFEKAKAYTTKIEDMEAVRGNIFDANGSLLATSLPFTKLQWILMLLVLQINLLTTIVIR